MKDSSICRMSWCVFALAFPLLAGCPGESVPPAGQQQSDGTDPDGTAETGGSTPKPIEIAASDTAKESDRLSAIDTLGRSETADEKVVSTLTELLGDDSASIRAHAAQALGKIGAPAKSAAEALVKLVADKDNVVQREAVEALGSIKPGPDVVIPLFNKLLREADPNVRLHVMSALADRGAEVVEGLIKALADEEARHWACVVLTEIGPDAADAVPALVKLLETEKDTNHLDLRREAILALAAIGPKAAPAVPELTAALDCVKRINSGAAAYALGSIGPEAKTAEAKLKELADAEDSPQMLQTVCLWALAKINPDDEEFAKAAVPRLIEALKAPDQMVRETAAQALIDLDPDPEITRPLFDKLMEEASPEAVNTILDALASLGENAVPRLIKALEHADARARAAAIIARIGPAAKEAVPALIEALKDENAQTRCEVLFAIAAIGPDAKEAVAAAIDSLGDPEEDVCYAACLALGKIGPDAIEAKSALKKNLAAKDEFLPMTSAWALVQIDPKCEECCKETVPILIKALQQPKAITRMHAAEALGALGPLAKDAVDALKKAAKDDDEYVSAAATEALKAVEG
ncbi:MAG: HEAT repeat domain-containing protein [Candidatus Nealsonbacteria bacterium]|nr:HEAT repeat domain-containing protein [Candidatus Nealsonbacteria bacterium]